MDDFVPESDFERGLREHCAGRQGVEPTLDALLAARLYLPSSTDPVDVEATSRFSPLIVLARSGACVMACTAPGRMPPDGLPGAPLRSGLEVDARWVFSMMPAGLGFVLNPGWPVGIELSAADLARFRAARGLVPAS